MSAASTDMLEIVPPAGPLRGAVTPPGSKSITNRALLVAALAKGESVLTGGLTSDDTRYMAEALRAMGVAIEQDGTTFKVASSGKLQQPEKPLFLGNAGTAVRFLTAACAFIDGHVVLDGDEHMRKRPIKPLVAALNSLGIDARSETGCPPVELFGNPKAFEGKDHIVVEIDGSLSSQYVSALLMAAPQAPVPVLVRVAGDGIGSRGYIDITLETMRAFGAAVHQEDALAWRIEPTGYKAANYAIEPDASAATYLWAWEKLTGGAIDIGIRPEEMSQPDAVAYEFIKQFPHLPAEIAGAQMQDAIPTLAVMAMFNATPVRFTGLSNLRVKECDRVSALSTELNKILPGLAREEGDDLIVNGSPDHANLKKPVEIFTYADHRIAMSFALAGLCREGIRILDPGCVAKTYPNYWRDLASVGVELKTPS